jgi:hypothetical protein
MHGETLWPFTDTRATAPRARHPLIFCHPEVQYKFKNIRVVSCAVCEYGCYNSKLRSGLLNNFTKKYCGTPLSNRVEMDQDHPPAQRNKKISKKMLRKTAKLRILIASQHFSMVLLWGQLHRDVLRFAN